MPVAFRAVSTPADRVKADLLVVPVFAERVPGPGADVVDRALGGGLGAFMEEAGFEGKPGEALAVPTRGALGAAAALLLGVGAKDEITAADVRRAAATLARRASKVRTVATTLAETAPEGVERGAVLQALAEGVVLGGYQYLPFKSEKKPSKLAQVLVLTRARGGARVQGALDRGALVANAVTWARDLVNLPSAEKSPAEFAAAAQKLLRGTGVRVEVLDLAAIKRQKLGGVLGVGQGSQRTPRFVRATYAPAGARGTLAFVGKGVVFDSGGLSIKTAHGMETMKTDMSGAAAVLAAMSVLRDAGVKTKVVAYCPMVENMPSGSAIRPGDVLRIRNGKTVEVLNTDAEGRLILADALSLAAEDGADAIVDVATLTGACMVALGEKLAGLMGNNDAWRDQVQVAAGRAGEKVWPLPLPDEYRKLLDSEVADLRNIGTGGHAGALTAGLFLESFTSGVPWAHLDIAGPARASADDGELVKGGTGFGVRTLVELAATFRTPGAAR